MSNPTHHPKPVSQLKALAVLMARLKAENDTEDDKFPLAYDGCQCACHRMHIIHFVACCHPPAEQEECDG
jgi:hypothetical protein